MEKANEFPKFECAISNTMEEYDSEVETFFTNLASVESEIGLLLHIDPGWKDNYRKMIAYLQDLETAIIFRKGKPDVEFLKSLIPEEDIQDEISDVLLRARDHIPSILVRARSKARDLGTLYVKMSRIPRFSEGFTLERFEGIPDLIKALWVRVVELSKR